MGYKYELTPFVNDDEISSIWKDIDNLEIGQKRFKSIDSVIPDIFFRNNDDAFRKNIHSVWKCLSNDLITPALVQMLTYFETNIKSYMSQKMQYEDIYIKNLGPKFIMINGGSEEYNLIQEHGALERIYDCAVLIRDVDKNDQLADRVDEIRAIRNSVLHSIDSLIEDEESIFTTIKEILKVILYCSSFKPMPIEIEEEKFGFFKALKSITSVGQIEYDEDEDEDEEEDDEYDKYYNPYKYFGFDDDE